MGTPIAIALPIRPGQLDAWRAFVAELRGPRATEYEKRQRRLGVTREQVFHQPTPQGDIAILVLETDDPTATVLGLGVVSEPFDRWLLDQLEELHGITPSILGQLRPGTLVAG